MAGQLSDLQRMTENLFLLCAPFILISRNYLNYHTVPQIIFGSTIGMVLGIIFFVTVGRKMDEGKETKTFFDKIIVAAEKSNGIVGTIADVTGVESLPAKDSQTKQDIAPQKDFPTDEKQNDQAKEKQKDQQRSDTVLEPFEYAATKHAREGTKPSSNSNQMGQDYKWYQNRRVGFGE